VCYRQYNFKSTLWSGVRSQTCGWTTTLGDLFEWIPDRQFFYRGEELERDQRLGSIEYAKSEPIEVRVDQISLDLVFPASGRTRNVRVRSMSAANLKNLIYEEEPAIVADVEIEIGGETLGDHDRVEKGGTVVVREWPRRYRFRVGEEETVVAIDANVTVEEAAAAVWDGADPQLRLDGEEEALPGFATLAESVPRGAVVVVVANDQ
jgi:hypothetical protein